MRYPGSKGKLSKHIVRVISDFIKDNNDFCYVEPFMGACAVGFSLLEIPHVKSFEFNDVDYGMYALWTATKDHPKELIRFIKKFKPSIKAFESFKQYLLNIPLKDQTPQKDVSIGFRKLAIHQISYSGLGTKSGGPLGGKEQSSDYKIDCRWTPENLVKDIKKISLLMREKDVTICDVDFEIFMKRANFKHKKCIYYLDPPYYVKGPELYQCSFTESDHKRLAEFLRQSDNPWLLSYDDCPKIKSLYDFAVVKEVPLNYTINGSIVKTELLIAPKSYGQLVDEELGVRDIWD